MSDREAVISAAEKYLFHGLVEHDPEKVPLAREATRTEQGRNTGDSREAIAKSLRTDIMKVITGIRNDFRQIVRIRQSVEIQTQLIEDQEKNLRKAQIEFDQGTASNRDVVDAQRSLVGALNDLIDERVNYEITRLGLLQDLGILFVDENGVWMEP